MGGNESKINPQHNNNNNNWKWNHSEMFRFTRALLSSTSFSFIDSQCSLASNIYIYQRATINENLIILPCLFFIDSAGAAAFFSSLLFFPSPSAYPKVPYIIKMAYCCRRRPDGRSRLPSQAVADSSPFSNDGANLRRGREREKQKSYNPFQLAAICYEQMSFR